MALALGIALVPLLLGSILSWQMLEAATLLGFHPEVEQGLRRGAEEARDRYRAERVSVRAALEAASRMEVDGCASVAGLLEGWGLEAQCLQGSPQDAWLAELVRTAGRGPEIVERSERGPVYGRLRIGDQVLVMQARSTRPAAASFEELQQTERGYGRLARARSTIANRFLALYLALAGALTAIALWIARRVALRILGPVSRLMEAVRRIGAGETRLELGPRPKGELGQLMDAVERLAGELAHSRERLLFLDKVAHWQEAARRLAHEIQNPLTPIQLICQELRFKHRQGDPQFASLLESSVDIVEAEVASLRRLVQTFSSFARLPEPRPEPLDLTALIRSFLDSRAGLHPQLELRLHAPGPLQVQADADLLRQVLRNLLDNSVEAMRGRGRVDYQLQPGSLVVRDTGPGVPPALRDRIFDPYVSGRSHGSGLGLAICRKILFDHGWDIELLPEPGGAAFRIRFPESSAP